MRLRRIVLGVVLAGAACSLADFVLVPEGFTMAIAPSSVALVVQPDGGPAPDASAIAVMVTIMPGARFTDPVTVTLEDAGGVVCAPITIAPTEAGTWTGTLMITADVDASSPGLLSATVHATSDSGFSSNAAFEIRLGKFLAISDGAGCRTLDGQTSPAFGPCSVQVPSNVTEVWVYAVGGGGGGGTGTSTKVCQSPPGFGGQGGFGGYIAARIHVTPGQTLDLVVGHGGARGDEINVAGGSGDPYFGASGGGGGLSGVFVDGGPLVIAGGGGGGGGGACANQNPQVGAAGGSGSGANGDPGGGYFSTFGGGGGGTADAGGANGFNCSSFPMLDAGYLTGGGCTNPGKIDGGGALLCFGGGPASGGAGTLATGPLAMTGGGGGGDGWYGGGAGGPACTSNNHLGGGGGGGSGGVAASVWVADAGLIAVTPTTAINGRGAAGTGGAIQGVNGGAGFTWIVVP